MLFVNCDLFGGIGLRAATRSNKVWVVVIRVSEVIRVAKVIRVEKWSKTLLK